MVIINKETFSLKVKKSPRVCIGNRLANFIKINSKVMKMNQIFALHFVNYTIARDFFHKS